MTKTACSVAGCTNPVRSKGLCNGHRLQLARGVDLKPVQVPCTRRDDQGRKWCARCSNWLDVSLFTKSSVRADGLDPRCGDCKRYAEAVRRYNLTDAQVQQMLSDQGHACAVCRDQFQGSKPWHVDHDHSCCAESSKSCGQCVRGLLCGPCNRGMGCFRDDAARLRKAAAYLER